MGNVGLGTYGIRAYIQLLALLFSVMRRLQPAALPRRSAQFVPLTPKIGLNARTRLQAWLELLEFRLGRQIGVVAQRRSALGEEQQRKGRRP